MKSKDFFMTLKTQGKITNEDLDKFLETVPDFEFPDSAFKSFEERFMTVERASTHPDVVSKLRMQNLNPIDRDLAKIIEEISKVDKWAAAEVAQLVRQGTDSPDTYKQIAALAATIPKVFDKVKVAPNDEDAKKTIADQKKAIEELTSKFTTAQADYDKKYKAAEDGFTSQMSDYKMGSYLDKLVGSRTFADVYKDTRPTITKALLGEIKASNTLRYATKENGEEEIQVMETKDGALIPKFNGNTPVTIDMLIEEKFKPFEKQNGVENPRQTTTIQYRESNGQQQQTERRQGRSTEVK